MPVWGAPPLHRHFSSREALIKTLAWRALDEMEAAQNTACAEVTTASETLKCCFEALIPLGDRFRFLMTEPLETDPDFAAAFKAEQEETSAFVETAKTEGIFDRDIPTPWIVQAYDHLLYAAWESVKAQDTTPKQAADLAWQTLTSGLGVKP